MKKCFACGNEVKDEAIKCQFCNTWIDETAINRYQYKQKFVKMSKMNPKDIRKVFPGTLICLLIVFVSYVIGYFFGFWMGIIVFAIWYGILFQKSIKKIK